MTRAFLSGNEAFAQGVRLSRVQVVSAYPITPQTTVVEALAGMAANGELNARFLHVESEHSALSAAIGASMTGARTFTATSSQGLLYMAECLVYASGGRYPIVMMNACRSTALPWNIYGDQRDSLLLADSGWIQIYAKDAHEALDLALIAYRVAEDPEVSTPFMVCLDGFTITHTYEAVDVHSQQQADAFLPPYRTSNRFDFEDPRNLAFSAGPETNYVFKKKEHEGMLRVFGALEKAEKDFNEIFSRSYSGALETFATEDAEVVVVTLGAVYGLVVEAVKSLRKQGIRAGAIRLRLIRPFPAGQLKEALSQVRHVAVLEKDISFGYEGAVLSWVRAAVQKGGLDLNVCGFVAGLGGKDIPEAYIEYAAKTALSGFNGTRFQGFDEEDL